MTEVNLIVLCDVVNYFKRKFGVDHSRINRVQKLFQSSPLRTSLHLVVRGAGK